MTDDIITACPECDNTSVTPRVRVPGWYCRRCGASFPEPVRRPRRQDSPRRGLPGVLERTDADAVGGS